MFYCEHCCLSKKMFESRKFFSYWKKKVFVFQVYLFIFYCRPKPGFFPHTSVRGASWGGFFSFSSGCFGGRGKPKLHSVIQRLRSSGQGRGRREPLWSGDDLSLPEPSCPWPGAPAHTLCPESSLHHWLWSLPPASCATLDKGWNLALSSSPVCFPNWGSGIPGRSMSLGGGYKFTNQQRRPC